MQTAHQKHELPKVFRVEVRYEWGFEQGDGFNMTDRGFEFIPDRSELPVAFVSTLYDDTYVLLASESATDVQEAA